MENFNYIFEIFEFSIRHADTLQKFMLSCFVKIDFQNNLHNLFWLICKCTVVILINAKTLTRVELS